MARFGKNKKKAQLHILNEIRKQLVLQAERWGRKDFYTPARLEEYELEACEKIRGQFLAERANLGYELHLLTSDKKETLIKLERLESYIKKTERLGSRHARNLDRLFEKKYGEAYKALKALKAVGLTPKFSVNIKN